MSFADITLARDVTHCINYHRGMALGAKRTRPTRTCGLQLYVERGFEQTTVAEIAKLAGLTERTFFRYFADNESAVLGAEALQESS